MIEKEITVSATLTDAGAANLDGTLESLKSAGFVLDRYLQNLKVVVGRLPSSKLAHCANVAGVYTLKPEEEMRLDLPSS